MRNTKSKIIIVMCIALCLMVVGYAAFSTSLSITGTSNITSTWKVEFTKIEEVSKTSGVTIINTPTASGTSATFNVGLALPGDKIVYRIALENKGTIDALIQNIEASASDSPAIIYSMSGIQIGEEIKKQTTKTFDVTIEYDSFVTSQPEKTNKALTVDITIVQSTGASATPSNPNINQPLYLSSAIFRDNVAYADTNIDFSKTSEETGTNGLYVTSTNTEGNLPTYYFRGAVDNNYVKFGSYAIPPSCTYNGQDVYDDTLSNYVTAEKCTSTNVCNLGLNYAVGMDEETCNQTFEDILSGNLGFSTTETVCQYNGKIVMGMDFSSGIPVELTEARCTTGYVCDRGGVVFAGIDEETCLAAEGTYAYANFEYKAFNAYTGEKADFIEYSSDLWRIVRINEDGSIRIITQDKVGYSAFNENSDDNAYVGYMYGATGQSGNNAYNLTHSNDNPSTIKTFIDEWYVKSNLSNYSNYLADAGFCNDRSVAPSAGLWYSLDTALGYAQEYTVYGAVGRLANLKDRTPKENAQPQFKCPNEERDLFTTTSSTKGNKALAYPVGLLTMDEVAYAGAVYYKSNKSMYLSGGTTWTMSPFYLYGSGAGVWFGIDGGTAYDVADGNGIRPVANLKSTVEITGGDGTSGNPYIIK